MNDNAESILNFFQTEVSQSSVGRIALELIVAAILAFGIGRFYIRYGTSLSNRRAFAKNFVLLSMTTTMIIALIQANVALSLGMIGALSIVRFRSAIKEPEELSYLFLSIAVGLGLGAKQEILTIGSVVVVLLVLWMKSRVDGTVSAANEQNLYLTITTERPDQLTAKMIAEIVSGNCSLHRLKRLDQGKGRTEACYIVAPQDANSLSQIEVAARDLDDSVGVSLLDTRGGMMAAG